MIGDWVLGIGDWGLGNSGPPLGISRAVSFPKMGKIARFKQIKIESKRIILVKNFCAFNPKYAIFLCVFATAVAKAVGRAAERAA